MSKNCTFSLLKIGIIRNGKLKEICDRYNLFGLKFNQWKVKFIQKPENWNDLKSKVTVANQGWKYESYPYTVPCRRIV